MACDVLCGTAVTFDLNETEQDTNNADSPVPSDMRHCDMRSIRVTFAVAPAAYIELGEAAIAERSSDGTPRSTRSTTRMT